MKIIGCVAVCDDLRTIGEGDGLPWGPPLREDMRRFRALTIGKPVIVGRRTFLAMPRLYDRHPVVLTRSTWMPAPGEGVAAGSLNNALGHCFAHWDMVNNFRQAKGWPSLRPEACDAVVIGGARVFEAAWPVLDEVHVTRVHCHPGPNPVRLHRSIFDLVGGWSLVSTEIVAPGAEPIQEFFHFVRRRP